MDVGEVDIGILSRPSSRCGTEAPIQAPATLSRIEAVLATAIARKWRKNANVAAWKVFKHVAPKRPGGDD